MDVIYERCCGLDIHKASMGKVLEGANIKLTSVASKMDTVSGTNMIRALSEGVVDPALLASMAKGALRKKTDELKRALNGS